MKNYLLLLFVLFLSFGLKAQTVLMHDEFKDNSNKWQVGKTAVSDVSIDYGRDMYVIQHKSKDTKDAWTVWTELDINENKNFRISALMYKQNGVKNYGYGLLWGGAPDNYYSFLISPSGFYCVGKVVNGIWNDITPEWVETETVTKGRHAWNKLTLSKIGDTYHFEINDLKVATMKCGPFFGNKIGFNINNKQKVLVEWIKVEYLN